MGTSIEDQFNMDKNGQNGQNEQNSNDESEL